MYTVPSEAYWSVFSVVDVEPKVRLLRTYVRTRSYVRYYTSLYVLMVRHIAMQRTAHTSQSYSEHSSNCVVVVRVIGRRRVEYSSSDRSCWVRVKQQPKCTAALLCCCWPRLLSWCNIVSRLEWLQQTTSSTGQHCCLLLYLLACTPTAVHRCVTTNNRYSSSYPGIYSSKW